MAYRAPIALIGIVVTAAIMAGIVRTLGDEGDGVALGGPPLGTPTQTATGTATFTPTSNRPYQLHIYIQDHYPASPATGGLKTWVLEYGNYGTIYGCDTSPIAGLSVTLQGHVASGFVEVLGTGAVPLQDEKIHNIAGDSAAGSDDQYRGLH